MDCRLGTPGRVGQGGAHCPAGGVRTRRAICPGLPSICTVQPPPQAPHQSHPPAIRPSVQCSHCRQPLPISPTPPLAFEESPSGTDTGRSPCCLLGVPGDPSPVSPLLAHLPSIWGSRFPPPGSPAHIREPGGRSQTVHLRPHHERSYIQRQACSAHRCHTDISGGFLCISWLVAELFPETELK